MVDGESLKSVVKCSINAMQCISSESWSAVPGRAIGYQNPIARKIPLLCRTEDPEKNRFKVLSGTSISAGSLSKPIFVVKTKWTHEKLSILHGLPQMRRHAQKSSNHVREES